MKPYIDVNRIEFIVTHRCNVDPDGYYSSCDMCVSIRQELARRRL